MRSQGKQNSFSTKMAAAFVICISVLLRNLLNKKPYKIPYHVYRTECKYYVLDDLRVYSVDL